MPSKKKKASGSASAPSAPPSSSSVNTQPSRHLVVSTGHSVKPVQVFICKDDQELVDRIRSINPLPLPQRSKQMFFYITTHVEKGQRLGYCFPNVDFKNLSWILTSIPAHLRNSVQVIVRTEDELSGPNTIKSLRAAGATFCPVLFIYDFYNHVSNDKSKEIVLIGNDKIQHWLKKSKICEAGGPPVIFETLQSSIVPQTCQDESTLKSHIKTWLQTAKISWPTLIVHIRKAASKKSIQTTPASTSGPHATASPRAYMDTGSPQIPDDAPTASLPPALLTAGATPVLASSLTASLLGEFYPSEDEDDSTYRPDSQDEDESDGSWESDEEEDEDEDVADELEGLRRAYSPVPSLPDSESEAVSTNYSESGVSDSETTEIDALPPSSLVNSIAMTSYSDMSDASELPPPPPFEPPSSAPFRDMVFPDSDSNSDSGSDFELAPIRTQRLVNLPTPPPPKREATPKPKANIGPSSGHPASATATSAPAPAPVPATPINVSSILDIDQPKFDEAVAKALLEERDRLKAIVQSYESAQLATKSSSPHVREGKARPGDSYHCPIEIPSDSSDDEESLVKSIKREPASASKKSAGTSMSLLDSLRTTPVADKTPAIDMRGTSTLRLNATDSPVKDKEEVPTSPKAVLEKCQPAVDALIESVRGVRSSGGDPKDSSEPERRPSALLESMLREIAADEDKKAFAVQERRMLRPGKHGLRVVVTHENYAAPIIDHIYTEPPSTDQLEVLVSMSPFVELLDSEEMCFIVTKVESFGADQYGNHGEVVQPEQGYTAWRAQQTATSALGKIVHVSLEIVPAEPVQKKNKGKARAIASPPPSPIIPKPESALPSADPLSSAAQAPATPVPAAEPVLPSTHITSADLSRVSSRWRTGSPVTAQKYLQALLDNSSNSEASSRLLRIMLLENVDLDSGLGMSLLDLACYLRKDGALFPAPDPAAVIASAPPSVEAPLPAVPAVIAVDQAAAEKANTTAKPTKAEYMLQDVLNKLNDHSEMLNAIAQVTGVDVIDNDDDTTECSDDTPVGPSLARSAEDIVSSLVDHVPGDELQPNQDRSGALFENYLRTGMPQFPTIETAGIPQSGAYYPPMPHAPLSNGSGLFPPPIRHSHWPSSFPLFGKEQQSGAHPFRQFSSPRESDTAFLTFSNRYDSFSPPPRKAPVAVPAYPPLNFPHIQPKPRPGCVDSTLHSERELARRWQRVARAKAESRRRVTEAVRDEEMKARNSAAIFIGVRGAECDEAFWYDPPRVPQPMPTPAGPAPAPVPGRAKEEDKKAKDHAELMARLKAAEKANRGLEASFARLESTMKAHIEKSRADKDSVAKDSPAKDRTVDDIPAARSLAERKEAIELPGRAALRDSASAAPKTSRMASPVVELERAAASGSSSTERSTGLPVRDTLEAMSARHTTELRAFYESASSSKDYRALAALAVQQATEQAKLADAQKRTSLDHCAISAPVPGEELAAPAPTKSSDAKRLASSISPEM